MEALKRARENDKQVAVLLELKARGDEENNIEWAQELEEAGVPVYGIVGLKTHAKASPVVRREGTGSGATCTWGRGTTTPHGPRLHRPRSALPPPELGADVTDLFNRLTGYSRQYRYRRPHVSPGGWRNAWWS